MFTNINIQNNQLFFQYYLTILTQYYYCAESIKWIFVIIRKHELFGNI